MRRSVGLEVGNHLAKQKMRGRSDAVHASLFRHCSLRCRALTWTKIALEYVHSFLGPKIQALTAVG
jgi:hypothetical protein